MYNKLALNLLGKYLICIIMCFLTVSAFVLIFTLSGQQEAIGNTVVVYENEQKENVIDTYQHYYEQGVDTKAEEYKKQGYYIDNKEPLPGRLSGASATICYTFSQIVSLFFFVIIVPRVLHTEGSGDINRVSRGIVEEDKLKGLKAAIPLAAVQFASWVLLVLSKFCIINFGGSVYTFTNYHLYGYQLIIFDGMKILAKDISFLSIILALLPVLLTLVVCYLTYLLAYKDINLYERLVYKKNK